MNWMKKIIMLFINILAQPIAKVDHRKTILVIRQNELKWEKTDGENLYKFLNTLTGRKWLQIAEDSIIQDIIVRPGERIDIQALNDFVAGKTAIFDFLKRHSVRANDVSDVRDPQDEKCDKTEMAPMPIEGKQ